MSLFLKDNYYGSSTYLNLPKKPLAYLCNHRLCQSFAAHNF